MPKFVQRVRGVSKDGAISFSADLFDDGTLKVDRKTIRKSVPGDPAEAEQYMGGNENATRDKQKILGLKDGPDPKAPKSIVSWTNYGSARMVDGSPPYRKVIR